MSELHSGWMDGWFVCVNMESELVKVFRLGWVYPALKS